MNTTIKDDLLRLHGPCNATLFFKNNKKEITEEYPQCKIKLETNNLGLITVVLEMATSEVKSAEYILDEYAAIEIDNDAGIILDVELEDDSCKGLFVNPILWAKDVSFVTNKIDTLKIAFMADTVAVGNNCDEPTSEQDSD